MRPVAEGFGHQELDRVKWRAKAGIVGLAISAAVVTFIALPPARLLHIFVEQAPVVLEAIKPYGLTGLLIVLGCGLITCGLRHAWRSTRAGPPPHAPSPRVQPTGETQGAKQLKRPSFLPEPHTDDSKSDKKSDLPHSTGPSAQSAAGFLMRFRRSLTLGENDAEAMTQAPPVRKLVRHPRFRVVAETANGGASVTAPMPGGQDAASLKPNELRHYLNQRLASGDSQGLRKPRVPAPVPRRDETGPPLTSLDTVLSRVFAAGQGGAPRALLVGSARAGVDATAEAVSIARALVAGGDQVVLVDLACGPASISGTLGLPPSLGLAEFFAGQSRFEDIVRVDAETPLQVITAGDPTLAASAAANERFASVFEALTQAYDGVVLHADHEALLKFTSVLRFELSVAIAVVESAAGAGSAKIDLSGFSSLGCPVLVCEQGAKEAPVNLAAASNE